MQAYPNPSAETYETRLFRPYQDAFPPPTGVHPGHLVVNKPDLSAEHWSTNVECTCGAAAAGGPGPRPICKLCLKADALRRYDGPSCLLIPGNVGNHTSVST